MSIVSETADDRQNLDRMASHVAGRIEAATAGHEPFFHLMSDGLLPDEVFRAMRDWDLSAMRMDQRPGGEGRLDLERNRFFLHAKRANLQEVVRTLPPLALTFRLLSQPAVSEALRSRFRDRLEAAFGTADVAWEPLLSLVEDRSGYELLPHTDVPYKAITLLIYLAEDGADERLGTELFSLNDRSVLEDRDIMRRRVVRRVFDLAKTVPYRPNHAVAFAPSQQTFHGVAEVRGKVRRVLQYQLCVSDEMAAARRFVGA